MDQNANHAFWDLAVGGHVTAIVFRQRGSAGNLRGAASEGAALSYRFSPVVFRAWFKVGYHSGHTSRKRRRCELQPSLTLRASMMGLTTPKTC